MTEQERQEGAAHAMSVVLQAVQDKKLVPLVLVACEPDRPTAFTVIPCGPGMAREAAIAILEAAAFALRKQPSGENPERN